MEMNNLHKHCYILHKYVIHMNIQKKDAGKIEHISFIANNKCVISMIVITLLEKSYRFDRNIKYFDRVWIDDFHINLFEFAIKILKLVSVKYNVII